MAKLPILIINNAILFPGMEYRGETVDFFEQGIIDAVDKTDNKELIIIHSIDNISTDDVTEFPKIGLLATLTLKLNIPNSKMRYIFIGLKRIEITSYEEENGVYYANYKEIENTTNNSLEEDKYLNMLYRNYERYVREISSVSNAMLGEISSIKSLDKLTDFIVSFLNLSPDTKKSYLYELDPIKRAINLVSQLKEEINLAKLEKEIEAKVHKRIDEDQRKYYLSEKLKIISNELGTVSSKNMVIDNYNKKLKKLKCSNKVRNKIKEEIEHYKSINENVPEASILREYLDLMLSLPWDYKTKDVTDIKEIENTLNNSHYGLTKVKERIVEYIAVKQNSPKEKSPILCLIGPPGVGKTSLAKTIAKALNRRLVSVSVGGVNDEAEIVGHRRTYVGALPGRIISGIRKCGSSNPVFIIDEIDKMTKNFRGDPASSLLEVLDKEQNSTFYDHYLEEEYDLSSVLFIATANYEDQIPPELRDRLEIIYLDSYTEYEKLSIAKNYLIPKALDEHGLASLQVNFSDQAILDIINYYTKEAGVRNLERLISKILRKIVKQVLTLNEPVFYEVTSKDLEKYLDRKIYTNRENKETKLKGVVNGLAYTPYGGDILPIEVNHYKGSSNLVLTGSLGDVMQESAKIALSYIKANAKKFNLPKSIFDDDIHIHVPEGAIPKEGPSAGIALTTALISAFTNIKISTHIAMTGEITLQGDIIEIGGVKEKVLGAYREGVKTIYLPLKNKADVKDVPKEIREKLEFIYVSNYKELYKKLFVSEEVCS